MIRNLAAYWQIRRFIAIGACLFFAVTCAAASVHKIGPDLYAYISQNDSSANSTFLVTGEGILVVDTGLNDIEGRKLLRHIRAISDAPVKYVVNTHYHPDHRGGDQIIGPNAIFIGTGFTRDKIVAGRKTPSSQAMANWITFPRGVTIHLGGYEVQVYHPGPAHTRGDAVVYFPQQHAIATGDLFLTNSCPAMDDGDMENWIVALDQILSLPVDHVVPGHFELAGKPELRRFRDYLADLRDQVGSLYHEGLTLDQIKKRLDLRQFTDFRQYPRYEATFADNAASYYSQLKAKKAHGSQ
ncbi:MAG TPA: MBL fold metallo-hydrolase [Candidatus Limnocylindrales bacterium]|nr:MBL fold metallo-hydrolase [Candidatus Limnocylindrales bacterium]